MRVINFLFAKNHKKNTGLKKTVGVLLLCVTLLSAWSFPKKAEAAQSTFGNQNQITVQLPAVSQTAIFSDGALINGTIVVNVPSVDADGDGSIGVNDTDEQKSWSIVEMSSEATQADGFTLTAGIFLMIKPDTSNTIVSGSLLDLTPKMTVATSTFTKQVNGLLPDTVYYARIVAPKVDNATNYYVSDYVTFKTKNDGSSVASTENQNDPNSQYGNNIPEGVPSCGFGDGLITESNSSMMGCLAVIVYYAIYIPSSWLAMLGGFFLDFFMGYSISSGAYTASSFPEEGWKMLRDLANICFIFLLVYAGIRLILDIGKFDAKKTITNVLIMALLINFSLFFTKVIIDAGNITARIFYNALEVKNKADGTPNVGIASEKAISVTLIDQVDPQKIMATAGEDPSDIQTGDSEPDPEAYAGYFILITLVAAAVNLYFMFVFFSVGFLFVGRTLQLWVSMITAPIACISYASGSGFHDGWWKDLWKSAFVAPIFLFFLYLIASFLRAGLVTGLFSNYNDKGFISILMAVAVPFVLLVGLMKIAKEKAIGYSSDIGKGAANALGTVGKVAGGLAIGAATGGASLAMSRTVGAGATKALSTNTAQKLREMESKGGFKGFIAGKTLKTTEKVSKNSFDIRNSKLGAYAEKQSGMKFNDKLLSNVNLSTANTKDGYKGELERKKKQMVENAKSMKTSFKDDKAVKAYYEKKRSDYEKKRLADLEKYSIEKTGKSHNIAEMGADEYNRILAEHTTKYKNKKGDIPPEIITRDEASKYLKQQYAKALKEGGFYGKISEKARQYGITSGTGSVDLGTVAGVTSAKLGLGIATTTGVGLGVAAGAGVILGGSQSTRQAEQGAASEIEKMITSDSKLAAKEKLLKEKKNLLEGKVEEGTKPVADQQVDLKKEISELDVELGQLNQTIKQQNESLFAFTQNLAQASLGKADTDVIVVKVGNTDVTKTVAEHRADEKTQKDALIANTTSKNEKSSLKKDKEGELTGLNNLKSDVDKLEKEIEGMKNKGKKGGDGGEKKKE